MNRITLAGLTALTIGVVSGCATVASGTTQSISISSNVEGAELFLDGERIGTTPYTGEVAKGKNTLRVEAAGYRTETVTLSRALEPIFWGNIIIGGTLGSITDFATGSAYQYAPATYQVELQATDQSEEDYRQQLAVRKFSILYIDQISQEVASGEGGDYLRALSSLMEEYAGSALSAEEVSEALRSSRGHPVVFAKTIADTRE